MAEWAETAVAVATALGLGGIAAKAHDKWQARRGEEIAAKTVEAATYAAELERHGNTKAELATALTRLRDIEARNDELSTRAQAAELKLEAVKQACEIKLSTAIDGHARELSDAMRFVLETVEQNRRNKS